MYKSFKELKEARLDPSAARKRIVVAGAADAHALEAVFLAQEKGYVTPVLVGNQDEISRLVAQLGFREATHETVHCSSDTNPSAVAVSLVHEDRGDFILKGKMETRDLLKPILNKESGLNEGGFITHFGLM